MYFKLCILVSCLVAMTCLCGCENGNGTFDLGSLFGSGSSSGTGSSGSGEAGAGSGGSDSNGDAVGLVHHPEPATLGLVGSGLFAYALLKKRRKGTKLC